MDELLIYRFIRLELGGGDQIREVPLANDIIMFRKLTSYIIGISSHILSTRVMT